MGVSIRHHLAEIKTLLGGTDVVLVVGETGCGKSTQVPRYLYRRFLEKNGLMVGVTQPRRIAAVSLARYVSREMGTEVGGLVGYSVRFEEKTTSKTRIKYCTDGMLMRELLGSELLDKYGIICLDEVHERSVRTDILVGMLKRIQEQREVPLKLVIMSATMDILKFQTYFPNAKLVHIKGKQYPVRIFYTTEPRTNYLETCVATILQIHRESPPGDILVFLSGQDEIETCTRHLENELSDKSLEILQMYSALSLSKQQKIFTVKHQSKEIRRVILSTNISETSLTIPNVKYVVDTGMAKVKMYHSQLDLESLVVMPISQMSSQQRCGRAGRQGPGFCYRLYPEPAYFQLSKETLPEIKRSNLSSMLLFMKAHGIHNVSSFDYIDPPSKTSLSKGLEELYLLEALDNKGTLTSLGRTMVLFPLDPKLARVLLKSVDMKCTEEILSIISLLSVENVFVLDDSSESFLDESLDSTGDHMTLLNRFNKYRSDPSRPHQRRFREARKIRSQLVKLCRKMDIPVQSCQTNPEIVLRCFLAGFMHRNLAVLQPNKTTYRTIFGNHLVKIHPTSTLFSKKTPVVMYHELVFTTQPYMRGVSRIDPVWVSSKS